MTKNKKLVALSLMAVIFMAVTISRAYIAWRHSDPFPAWRLIASFPRDQYRYQGFGVRGNGEFVIAGGIDDMAVPSGTRGSTGLTAVVSFYTLGVDGFKVVRRANLPQPMARATVAEIGRTLYVFDGILPTAHRPNPAREVFRYDEASNTFIADPADPGYFAYNYAGSNGQCLISINPPESITQAPPNAPPIPPTINLFRPGQGWQSFAPASLAYARCVAVIGSDAYMFGGRVWANGAPGPSAWHVDLDTGSVKPLSSQPENVTQAFGACAIVLGDVIHIHHFGQGQTPVEFHPYNGTFAERRELRSPLPLDSAIVSGRYVFVTNMETGEEFIYEYRDP